MGKGGLGLQDKLAEARVGTALCLNITVLMHGFGESLSPVATGDWGPGFCSVLRRRLSVTRSASVRRWHLHLRI